LAPPARIHSRTARQSGLYHPAPRRGFDRSRNLRDVQQLGRRLAQRAERVAKHRLAERTGRANTAASVAASSMARSTLTRLPFSSPRNICPPPASQENDRSGPADRKTPCSPATNNIVACHRRSAVRSSRLNFRRFAGWESQRIAVALHGQKHLAIFSGPILPKLFPELIEAEGIPVAPRPTGVQSKSRTCRVVSPASRTIPPLCAHPRDRALGWSGSGRRPS